MTAFLKRQLPEQFKEPKRMRFDPEASLEPIVKTPRFFTEAQLEEELRRRMAEESARIQTEHRDRVRALQNEYAQNVNAMEEELKELTRMWTERPVGDYIS